MTDRLSNRLSQLLNLSAVKPPGTSAAKEVIVTNPLIVMFKTDDDNVICHIHPSNYDHKHYGLLICDLVRHLASAFKVDENDVWEWVDKERRHPTTEIKQAS